ncbi:hypothetical protein Bbelb_194200 [Branchiostoma belcheri]|nr:hypothetical protein Bbelb_194200 [Branchiostoma belcheri]
MRSPLPAMPAILPRDEDRVANRPVWCLLPVHEGRVTARVARPEPPTIAPGRTDPIGRQLAGVTTFPPANWAGVGRGIASFPAMGALEHVVVKIELFDRQIYPAQVGCCVVKSVICACLF